MKPYPQGHTLYGRLFKGAKPKAAPLSDPPVTETQKEVKFASDQAKKDAQKRKGQLATLYAGETGGYSPQNRKSLLG